MPAPDTCIHCKLPIPPADLVVDRIDGQELHFCCRGCQGVYRIVSGAGLKRFYQQRDWSEKGVPQGVFDVRFDEAQLAGHVIAHDDENAEISLIVEGIRCASCVWLLERLLAREPGITAVRVNYGTHRAQLRFNPRETSPARIFASVSRLGYFPHPFTAGTAQQAAAREQRALLIRFGTAAFLSMQVMGFSLALYGGYFHGIEPRVHRVIQYFAAAATAPVIFYSGWPFLAGAWRSLKNRVPSMDLLISLGVLTAFSYSVYVLFTGGEVYFETSAMIVTLILLGRLFEGSARNRAISGIDKLLQLAPDRATRLDGGEHRVVASASLSPGDTILVRPGERIPVDCRISEGVTELDEATISGEPMPVLRRPGDSVAAGTLNMTASISLVVERVAADSFIARMARMVEEAQNRKAPIQSLADRVAALFVPFVTLVALGTWIFWFFSSAPHAEALLNAVAVLIVACPCALGLATPTAILVASGSAASRGILFRGGDIIEMAGHIDLIAFDKTGTLTLGRPTVSEIVSAQGTSVTEVLRLASQVESGSGHPLAQGILDRARSAGIPPRTAGSVVTIPGRGLRMGSAEGEVLVGSRAFLAENGVEIPDVASGDMTEVHVSLDGSWQGALLVHDPLREDARAAVRQLQQSGLGTVLLTGDRPETAARVCAALAMADNYQADLSPAGKAAWIRRQQAAGKKVMMVGDGINDAPALAIADIGCAMAGGTDIALETSDLVLTRPALGRLHETVFIARLTLHTIRQNLFWAFSYNLVTIPLAASGQLAPVWAAIAMAGSSVLVISNSLRLGRRVRRTFSVANGTANN
jgi:Cu2+-exporting ATPase